MIKNDFCNYLQTKANSLISSGYTCEIINEIVYKPFDGVINKLISATVHFGSTQKINDFSNIYTVNYVIDIDSEKDGLDKASNLFNDIFQEMANTTITLGEYNAKVVMTAPTLSNPFEELGDGYTNHLVMTGSITFSKDVILGSKIECAINEGSYTEIKVLNPSCVYNQIFASNNVSNSDNLLVKEGANRTIRMATYLLNNAFCLKMLDICYTSVETTFKLKITIGGRVYELANLKANVEQNYDNATGMHTLSLTFYKVGV